MTGLPNPLPYDRVVYYDEWQGGTGIYLDPDLNLLVGGEGKCIGMRLTPVGALQLAERLLQYANEQIAASALETTPAAGSA